MPDRKDPWKIIRLLAITQIVSWGSLFYAFAIVAHDIQRELGWRTELVFGAYSWSLLVSGLAATPAGMLIDRYGGRWVMGIGSLLAGAGMIGLALSHSFALYLVSWTVIGFAMAMVLYEAAFATINREFLHSPRKGISVLTLFGGLASTVFWPLTLKLNGMLGWRDTFLVYGLIHLLLCAPLHALLHAGPRRAVPAAVKVARDYTLHEALRDPTFWKLAFAFSANMFIFSSLSVHLIPLLQRFGHSAGMAVLVSTLIGPMQVAGRIVEMTLARNIRPQMIGKLTFASMPAGLLALLFLGQHEVAVAAFCILYGASNGVLTIVRGTVPQVLFGRENYGAISGALAGPSLLAKSAGPIAAAAFIEFNSSPAWLLGILFAVSVLSLVFFLAAVRSERAGNAMAME
ncbi:MAG TPA: MFS transporter [Noviherbaspirillum sp.]|uniref:MFS transporter n=1 Tax=Noviherbaspirillum sp. TaxID=1926288 RepID=UPI002B472754|nr:MFS transporter [Noviherbaspirillum sp.]HJV87436.1 MFS transporter [Noviherbaspirillum sp.]